MEGREKDAKGIMKVEEGNMKKTVKVERCIRSTKRRDVLSSANRSLLVFAFLLYSVLSASAVLDRYHNEISSSMLRQREKTILDKIIGPANYDKRIRPSGRNDTGPTEVFINVMVRNVQTISDVKMEYSIQITFRSKWIDDRLKFNNMGGRIQYLTLTESSMVWMPDLFFKNERKGNFHNIILPNLYIRIFPNGEVLYSIRISLTLSCPMDLKLFPLDKQMCQLMMASYGWTTEDLVFTWERENPVQVVDLHLPRFQLQKYITAYCNSKTNTGAYSCLAVNFVFERQFSFYFLQYYIPSCMIVIVSWFSFWIDANSVPARVSLAVTTLLTMSTQMSSINQTLPPVSYTKAIDIWTGVCLTFVFAALLEFALVNYAARSDKHLEKLKEKMKQWDLEQQTELQEQLRQGVDCGSSLSMKPLVSSMKGSAVKSQPCELHPTATTKKIFCKSWLAMFPARSKRIDVISRVMFPMVFAIFNLAYWTTFLPSDDSDETEVKH